MTRTMYIRKRMSKYLSSCCCRIFGKALPGDDVEFIGMHSRESVTGGSNGGRCEAWGSKSHIFEGRTDTETRG